MLTFLQKLGVSAATVLFCMPVAMAQVATTRDLEEENINRLDILLQQSDDSQERLPLANLYENILQDAVAYPKNQTMVEFERRFGEKTPSFGSALLDQNTLSGTSAAGQAINRSIKEQEERVMFGRNIRFLDVYLVGKYLSLFMNGDRSDSSYDVFLDLEDVQVALTGDPGTTESYLPPRFSAGASGVSRYLKGAAINAVQISEADKNNRIRSLIDGGTVTFNEGGIPVCTLPGVVQDGSVTSLDADTRKAILGRIVDLEEVDKAATQAQDNAQLLTHKGEEDLFTRILKGENIPLQNLSGCLDTYCIRLDFIKSVPRLAPPPLVRPLPILVNLKTMEDITRKLSNTPLETKQVSKNIFSYSFANLNLLGQNYTPGINIVLRAVPVFQAYDAAKAFTNEGFDQILTNYNSILLGNLNRTASTIINPDRLPGSQVLTDAARQALLEAQQKQYKDTMLLRTIIYWNATYLKVVGDRTIQLEQQVALMGEHLQSLSRAVEQLNKGAKTLYNEGK